MTNSIEERIIGYIRTNHQARAHDLWRALFSISRAALHRRLKGLVEKGTLKKSGKPPLVFYTLAPKEIPTITTTDVPNTIKQAINKDYLYITPQGELLPGWQGFITWAGSSKQANKIADLAQTYVKTKNQFEGYRKSEGWVDATFKLKETFPQVYINKLLYADFYSLPQFGKTKLGMLMLYAKQSQNRELINKICQEVKPLVKKIIAHFKIDSLAPIPPSLPRQIQFMTEFVDCLNLPLPKINLVKTKTGQVIVAQKTLNKLEERVTNARDTIFIKDATLPFKNVLLVDDAVGSGASLNETAKKIETLLPPSGKVIGFAVAGSFEGFEVIQEV